MGVTKKIYIQAGITEHENDIGADVPNIDVLRKTNGDIITDLTTEVPDATKTENLGNFLKKQEKMIKPGATENSSSISGAFEFKANGNLVLKDGTELTLAQLKKIASLV